MLKMTQLHQLESGDITVVEGVGLGAVVCVCRLSEEYVCACQGRWARGICFLL